MSKWLKLSVAAFAALVLAACASQPTDQTANAGSQPQAQQQQNQGVETSTMGEQGSGQMDELDNPDSPLSQKVIYFAFDKSDIKPEYLDVLKAHAEYLVNHPDVSVRLEGHTDERGSREYNIALGDRRAQSVRRVLLFQGVSADQISTVSYGEERPAVDGHTEDAYAKNRRVELVYIR